MKKVIHLQRKSQMVCVGQKGGTWKWGGEKGISKDKAAKKS